METKNKHPFALIYTGPTAVGKTSVVDAVAAAIPSEIINADVGQLYRPLTIGTAKPDLDAVTVPHHLFNVLDEPIDFTVSQYRQRVTELVGQIWERKRIPIIVGGSGFYIKSLFFPPIGHTVSVSQEYQHIPREQRWQHLRGIDPDRADAIDQRDYYRIERALDIWYGTGVKPSEVKPVFDPPCAFFLTGIMRDRDELYNRIDQRVGQMFADGWIEEVNPLVGTEWEEFLQRKKLIGYADIFQYLAEQQSQRNQEQLITTIQQKTRNYAKRQMTFWRGLQRQIDGALLEQMPPGPIRSKTDEVNLTTLSVDRYVQRLVGELNLEKNFSMG